MSAELAYGDRVAVRLHAAARMPCRGRGVREPGRLLCMQGTGAPRAKTAPPLAARSQPVAAQRQRGC